ncbi:hypothetical protein LINPERHAP1_LOCUS26910 [Linum perenne]
MVRQGEMEHFGREPVLRSWDRVPVPERGLQELGEGGSPVPRGMGDQDVGVPWFLPGSCWWGERVGCVGSWGRCEARLQSELGSHAVRLLHGG